MSARHRRKERNNKNIVKMEQWLERSFKPAFIYVLCRSLRETVIPAKERANESNGS